uniref:protein-tyrosine-phosphatase n=1 Tax=Crassostrea virginica TaxID=6565 RepID=A0A8B8CN99_CRAVI|nr:uncharacterized protein LOC111119720 isoform X2 [Crassostrea virginica]
MNLITFILVVNIVSFVNLIEAQCNKNGTCVCHCADCSSGCQSCSPGWSGSKENFCQKANTLYQFHSMNSEHINVLDGNTNTYEESKYSQPYIRVHLKESKVLSRLDITLQLDDENEYSVYVKDNKHAIEDSLICNTFTYKGVGTIQTIPFVCKQTLEGKYIHIVTSLTTSLRVYEIEQFECTNGSFGFNCSDICPNSCSGTCNKVTGQCACKTGFWGAYCNETCSMRCKDKLCDSASGVCVDCIPGNYGLGCNGQCSPGCQDICNTTSGFCQCKQGFYSDDCSLQCTENCNNRYCYQESGFCASCIPGKYGNFCKENCLGDCDGNCVQTTGLCGNCTKGKYGFYCNETCQKHCEGDICNRATGKCLDCVINAYGLYCNETCPKNCEGDICDRVTGRCNKCKIGYMGNTCLENCPGHCKECSQDGYTCNRCEDGWYDLKCEKRCHESCGGNTTCDINSGWCHVCSVGYFGNFCGQKCSDNCDASYMCDKMTGNCQSCKAGKRGSMCNVSCSEHCRNLSCSRNESCINGCEDGWFGPQCKYDCLYALPSCAKCKFIDDDDDEPVCQQCSNAWFLNGSKCSQCPRNCSSCLSDSKCHACKNNYFYGETCNLPCNPACRNKTCDITGQCILECDNSKYGTKCDQDCPVGCRSCHNASMCLSCEDGFFMNCESCQHNATCRECEKCVNVDTIMNENKNSIMDEDGLYIIPVLLTPLLFPCLVFLFLIGRLKHKWSDRKKPITACIRQVAPDLKRRDTHYENTGISLYNTRGSIAFLDEIDQGQPSDDVVEIKEENHVYVNIKISKISISSLWEYKLENTAHGTFDTEFKELPSGMLRRTTEATKKENKKRNRYKQIYPYDTNRVVLTTLGEDTSYINASYIDGHETSKEYIAAQGPFTDETVEDFWRMVWQENVNTIVILTNLEENGVIKCKKYWPSEEEERVNGGVHVKRLSSERTTDYIVRCFQILTENESRTLEQFHFTAWPDKGVPNNVDCILDFRRRIKSKADIRNPIVVHCSAGIGRTGTYIALDYLINQGQRHKSVDVINCVTKLRNQRAHLVQTVEQYIYLYGALTKELTGKQSMFREGEFLAYYNQMKISNTYTGKTDLEEEFSLIEKLLPGVNEIQCQAAKDINNRPKNRYSNILAGDNHRVYLNREGSDYINAIFLPIERWTGNYRLTPTSKKQRFDSFDLQSYQFHNKQEIHLYNGHLWKGKRFVPSGYRALASLVDAVIEERRNHSGSPVLVVCQNGAKRSGLFCVLANLVEQLHLYRSVDVLQTVLNVRHRRSQVVPCMEQLEYIYGFIENYLKMQNGEHVDELVYFNETNGLV